MSAACCARPCCAKPSSDHVGKRIDDAHFAAIQDQCIRDVVKLQEDVGPGGRDRRRIPPQLLLGPVRRAHRRLRHQAGGVQVPRRPRPRGGFHRALCGRQARRDAAVGARRVQLPARRHEGDAEDHHAVALDHAFLPLHGFCRQRRVSRRGAFFADLGRIFREEIADLAKAGCRYIQLDEVAVAMLCDPAIREKVEAAGQNPDHLVDLYIEASTTRSPARRPDMIVRRPHVPRQFQGPLSWQRAATNPSPSVFSASTQRQPFPAGIRHRARRRLQAAALRQGQGRGARALSAARRRCWKASTLSSGASTRRPQYIDLDRLAISPQCGFASTAPAIPSPRPTSGPN